MNNLHTAPGASVRGLALLVILLASGTLGVRLDAQAGKQGQDEEKRIELRKIRELVEGFKVYKVDDERVPAKLITDPLLRFTDAADRNRDGGLWAWGRTGRPSAIVQLWRNLPDGQTWFHSTTSLSSGLVVAERKGGWRWSPRKPGIKLKRLSQSPTPAKQQVAKYSHSAPPFEGSQTIRRNVK